MDDIEENDSAVVDDPNDEDYVSSDNDDILTSSFIVTRDRSKQLEDMRRDAYDEGCAKFEEDLRLAQNGRDKRAIVQRGPPPIIEPIDYPDFSGYICLQPIAFDHATFYPLKTALLLLLNAHLLQDWFFEPEYVHKFMIDLHGLSIAPNRLINRMIELRTTGYSKHLTIDEYIRKIQNSCPSITIRVSARNYRKLPDALIFALHVLSITGPLFERLGLFGNRTKIHDYIRRIVNHNIPSRNMESIHYEEEEEAEAEEEVEYYTFLQGTVNNINAAANGDPYEILGIPQGSDNDTILNAYLPLSRTLREAMRNKIDGAQKAYFAINGARCKCEKDEDEEEEVKEDYTFLEKEGEEEEEAEEENEDYTFLEEEGDEKEEAEEEEEVNEDYTFLEETVNKINATTSYWEILHIPEGSDDTTLTQTYKHMSHVIQQAFKNKNVDVQKTQKAYYALNEAFNKCKSYEDDDVINLMSDSKEEEEEEIHDNRKRKVIEVIDLLSDSDEDDAPPPKKNLLM